VKSTEWQMFRVYLKLWMILPLINSFISDSLLDFLATFRSVAASTCRRPLWIPINTFLQDLPYLEVQKTKVGRPEVWCDDVRDLLSPQLNGLNSCSMWTERRLSTATIRRGGGKFCCRFTVQLERPRSRSHRPI